MKQIWVFLFSVVLLFSSCSKDDYSTLNEECLSGCTVVSGIFTTETGKPVSNIPIDIRYEKRTHLGPGSIRRIASSKTGPDGRYFLKFSLRENEYGNGAQNENGYILLKFSFDKNKFLNIPQYDLSKGDEYIGPLSKKDTTITMDFHLATRTKIKIKLKNYSPQQPRDHFSVLSLCKVGANNDYSSSDAIEASGSNTEKTIDACGNQETTFVIRKWKNGVYTNKDTAIYTPVGQVTSAEFIY